MEAPGIYQRELELVGGKTLAGDARYRLHWTGDPMPGFPEHKFATPVDCWALIWWVDTDSERPGAGGGYAVLQAFWTQDERKNFVPTMLDTQSLNVNVVRMMAAEAERHRRDFAAARGRMLARQREKAGNEQMARIADILQDAAPQFTGPTSFAGNDALPTAVQQKVEQIEKNLTRTERWHRKMGRGPVVRKMKEAEANAN